MTPRCCSRPTPGREGRQLGLHGDLRRGGQPVLGRHRAGRYRCLATFPSTTGAFQTTFGGADGHRAHQVQPGRERARRRGCGPRTWAATAADFPSSLVVNAQNELLVLGSTRFDQLPHHRRRVAAQLWRAARRCTRLATTSAVYLYAYRAAPTWWCRA
ncbi:MAG: hypothetical protein WKG07_03530 [Hymenobacter sp.]